MKYLKKKKKKPIGKILLWILVIVLLLAAAAVAWTHLSSREEPRDPDGQVPEQTQTGTAAPEQTTAPAPVGNMTLQTPYGSFAVPENWGGYLHVNAVEGENGILRFTAKVGDMELPLFDFFFGAGPGEELGYVAGEGDSAVRVSVVDHGIVLPDDWSERDRQVVRAIQEGLDTLISQLEFTERTEEPVAAVTDYVVQTPFCQLKYPLNWQALLRTEVTEGENWTVRFFAVTEGHDDVPLFDITLSARPGGHTGSFTDTQGNTCYLLLTTHAFAPDESWDESGEKLVRAMASDAAYILDALTVSNGYAPAE